MHPPNLLSACLLCVTAWDETTAWFPGMGSYVGKQFFRLLQLSSPMSRAQAKTLVKKIAAREPFEVLLMKATHAQGMAHLLQSIGGQVSIRRCGDSS